MGNSVLYRRNKTATVYISDDIDERKANKPLPKIIFDDKELQTLKQFCLEKSIHQNYVYQFYEQFICNDTSPIPNFRMKAATIKKKFSMYSTLMRDLADIFIPYAFYRNLVGLNLPFTQTQEFSLSRFVIMSYIFGGQHILDTIYDFFAMLMQNNAIALSATILSYNFEQILLVLLDTDDRLLSNHSTINAIVDVGYTDVTLRILRPLLNPQNDKSMTIEDILRISIKYPILVYKLKKFHKLFQKHIFGAKFWETQRSDPLNNTPLKLRLENFDMADIKYDISACFESEKNAIRQTARSIINDVAAQSKQQLVITPKQPVHTLAEVTNLLSNEAYYRLKQLFGYKITSELIRESEYSCDTAIAVISPGLELTPKLPSQYSPHLSLPTHPETHGDDSHMHMIDDVSFQDSSSLVSYEDMSTMRHVHPENSLDLSIISNESLNHNKLMVFKQGHQSFSYDIATGEKTWIVQMMDTQGHVMKQFHSSGHNKIK